MATVKTAISIDPQLMKKVDAWVDELKISRSRLFVLGVEKLIQQYENKRMLETINNVYDDPSTKDDGHLEAMYNEFSHLMMDEEW